VEVVSQAFTAYRPFERTAPFNLLRLGPDVDTPACDRSHTDLDAVRRQAGRKLYGLRMHHFAAFGLDEWRAWDWLCGRLDAQVHLARALAGSSPQAPPERAEQVERWIEDIQRLTMAADPPGRAEAVTPDAFVRKRAALLDLTDGALLRELRGHPAGNAMIVGVVDAAMRALPEPLALGAPGLVANTLLARKPRTWFATVWTPFARPLARWWWRRRTHVFLRRTGR
jgi:hypothetical protein